VKKNKEKLNSWEDIKTGLLKDEETKKEYEKLEPEFQIIREIIRFRKENNLTQKELAEILETKQSNISRFESGNYNPSLKLLKKIAEKLGKKLVICFE
jgi:DNA-binding XRE family transcriptional regulator